MAALRAAWIRLRVVDAGQMVERLVLSALLVIAALMSYTHLQLVWRLVGAPWEAIGPLVVDGLFASAWLRMRRQRRQGSPVGWLSWLALGLALVAMLAGNVAAAFPAWVLEHRDAVAPGVYAWAGIASALAWELVTGHGARPRQRREKARRGLADEPAETWEQKRDRLLAEGASRKRLADELGISEWDARKLQDERRRQEEQETGGEATG